MAHSKTEEVWLRFATAYASSPSNNRGPAAVAACADGMTRQWEERYGNGDGTGGIVSEVDRPKPTAAKPGKPGKRGASVSGDDAISPKQ